MAALVTPAFYVEIAMLGGAVALAIVVATLASKNLRQHFSVKPPKHFPADTLLKMLTLMLPILAVIFLGIVTPFAQRYGDGGFWVDATVSLFIAYTLARSVLLVIRSSIVAYMIASVIMIMAMLQVTGFMESITAYLDSLAFSLGDIKLSVLTMIHAVIILVIVLWLASMLANTLEAYLRKTSSLSYNARELTVKFTKLFIYFVAILIALSAVGVDLTAFAVFGGALGVGIGLGLQRLTANFISGISLLAEKSVQIGDLIELGTPSDGIIGWVRQLNIRYTLVECFDGREILIPNEELMSTRVINWTHSNYRIRIDVNVGVAYGSDCRKVMELMLEAANEHPACMKDPKAVCFLREFADNSLNFTLAFWMADLRDGRLEPQSDVMIAVLEKFEKAGIIIPFPQRDVHIVSNTANTPKVA